MTPSTAETINQIWDDLNDDDISTEMLMHMTAEQAGITLGRDIDAGDICEALRICQKTP